MEENIWYPLRISYTSIARILQLKELLDKEPLVERTYIPMTYQTRNNETRLYPAITNIIFVKSTYRHLNEVRHSHRDYAPLRYMTRPVHEGTTVRHEIITIPTRMMDQFIRVTEAQSTNVIFLDNPEFAFKPGIRATITEGPYAGIVGEVKRIRKNLCLVLPLEGVAACAILNVPRRYLMKTDP